MRKLLRYGVHSVLLYAAWLGMMLVHELGHCVGAWVSGGEVGEVYFHPLDFSRTDLTRNPRPLLVAWAGPIFGAVAPLMVYLAAGPFCPRFKNRNAKSAIRNRRIPMLIRPYGAINILGFFGGFCLIVNGVYLAAGSFYPGGDPADLLRHGANRWQLFLFAAITLSAGLYIWHRYLPTGKPVG